MSRIQTLILVAVVVIMSTLACGNIDYGDSSTSVFNDPKLQQEFKCEKCNDVGDAIGLTKPFE